MYIAKTSRLARFPSEEGIIPLRLFINRPSQYLSEVMSLSSGGISPVNLFSKRSKEVKFINFPNSLEIWPSNPPSLYPNKFNPTKVVAFSIDGGNVLLKLFNSMDIH